MAKEISKEIQLDCFALFDEQFNIKDFKREIYKDRKFSKKVFNAVRKAVMKDTSDSDDIKLVVDMDDVFRESYKNGEIKLVTKSNGDMIAQVRNPDGKFGPKLSIKEELNDQGISADDVQFAAQLQAIEAKLEKIVEVLGDIEEYVTDIIQGQQNDRIGLYYSGFSLYLEARNIKDPGLRSYVTSQALKSLSDANSQMIQQIREDIQYLVNRKYDREKGKRIEKIEEKMNSIHKCFEIIYRSSFLKIAIYYENNETFAMLTAMDEYGRFINKMIAPYGKQLSELDVRDTSLKNGIWDRRANSLIECKDLKNMLTKKDVIYIGTEV